MKIYIISAKIYPNTSPRANRASELAKQLAKMGHDVTLCATLDDYDYSDFISKYNLKIIPIKTCFYNSRKKGTFLRKIFDKIAYLIFHKLIEYPEIELKRRVRQLLQKEKNIDYLITIAMPYPIHFGATEAKEKLKEGFPKFLASDCGDPYCGDPFNKHPKWSEATDAIVIPIESARKAYMLQAQSKIHVIPQGFDFSEIKIKKGFIANEYPIFAYSGYVYPGRRDPSSFLDYLATVDKKFKIVVYTQQNSFYSKYIDVLKDKIELRAYVPREQLIYELSSMDFLLNLVNLTTVQSPSKLIDYYLTKRPIIDISTPFQEKELIDDALNGIFHINKYTSVDVEQYNIKNIAKKFLELYKV